jgi:alcohol dehydrogenase (cytochrome c)
MTTRTSPVLLSPLSAALLLASLACGGAAQAKSVTWEDIADDHKTTGNVLQYGMGTNAQRWSPGAGE